MPRREDIENIDENEDIDGLFNVPELHVPDDATEEQKKKKLDEYIRNIQAKVKAYRTNDEALRNEIDKLQNDYVAKEMECKRLIAACCNLPIDKIDDLVEPLTLAIESDPPDLDLARVIGFMDKIRRQGAFAEPAITTTATTASTMAPAGQAASATAATAAAIPTVIPTSPDQNSTNSHNNDNPSPSLSLPNTTPDSSAL